MTQEKHIKLYDSVPDGPRHRGSRSAEGVDVLDKGFVRLTDVMGSDLKVVNTARVSFGKTTDTLREKDIRLIHYLAHKGHTSPFRHCHLTFHIKMPLFVARQAMKHTVGASWNEISGRYVRFEPEFYVPSVWRSQSIDVKQGSDGTIHSDSAKLCGVRYKEILTAVYDTYKALLRDGVCKEQARAVLPLALYTETIWTTSLQALAHFLRLRMDLHAQWEIREYARALHALGQKAFPVSLPALLNSGAVT